MVALVRALADYDLDLIRAIAAQWDVDLVAVDRTLAAEELAVAIAQPEIVFACWESLSADEQTALHDLQGHEGHLLFVQFTRRYGELRPMGPGKREREKPWLHPASVTEAL